jgi:DNA-binding response OmpR family regulator
VIRATAHGIETAATGCVLVVDDDPQVRQVIQWALEDDGLAVMAAPDGRTAIALASREVPDLVVLDLTLPEMDGYEVARAIRSGREQPIPFLVITGDGDASAKARRVGAYRFLRKPFRIEELLDAVHGGLKGTGE